ncbi:MAG: hypothetical protein R3D55_07995 [Chloroflexota bacterium]
MGIGAKSSPLPTFTLVSHDQHLNQLTAEQYVAYAQQRPPTSRSAPVA